MVESRRLLLKTPITSRRRLLAKYVKENYLDKGTTDEVAIRADLESKNLGVTTADLTMTMERLRSSGAPPTVAQVAAAEDAADAAGMKAAAAAAATPQPSPPINPAAQPTYPANTAASAANSAAGAAAPPNQSAPNQGAPPTPQPTQPMQQPPQPPAKAPIPVVVPPEFLMPVAEIDDLIRQGYNNEAIEASMKLTHQQTYRNVIRRRRIELDAELAQKAAAVEQRLAAANSAANPAAAAAAATVPVNPQNTGSLGFAAPQPQPTLQQPTLQPIPQLQESVQEVIAAQIRVRLPAACIVLPGKS